MLLLTLVLADASVAQLLAPAFGESIGISDVIGVCIWRMNVTVKPCASTEDEQTISKSNTSLVAYSHPSTVQGKRNSDYIVQKRNNVYVIGNL